MRGIPAFHDPHRADEDSQLRRCINVRLVVTISALTPIGALSRNYDKKKIGEELMGNVHNELICRHTLHDGQAILLRLPWTIWRSTSFISRSERTCVIS